MKHNERVARYHEAHDQPTLAAIRRLDAEDAQRALRYLHGSVGSDKVQRALDYVAAEREQVQVQA
jgi:hypothetical protein